HEVELVGELFELVRRLDVDALGKVAGAEPVRAGLQRPDRYQHVAGEKASRQHGDDKAERNQRGVAQEQIIERQSRLADGLFEEYKPLQVRDQLDAVSTELPSMPVPVEADSMPR